MQNNSEPSPIALPAQQICGHIIGVSLPTWRRMDAGGKIPRGFTVGGRKLWRVSDLERWAAAGFPDRAEFERAGRENSR